MKRLANEPAGRARHSVRAESHFLESGAQRTDAPYQIAVRMLWLITILFLAGCTKHDATPTPAADETKAESPWKVSHNTNDEVFVTLDDATQTHIGLKLATADARQLAAERKAYGRVVDPVLLSSAIADFEAARTTAEASQKELERIKSLAAHENASTRSLEAAQAAAARDSTQADAAKARLVGAWGKAIATRENLRAFVESLSSGASALIKLDLPAGETLKTEPTGARVIALGDGTTAIEAAYLSAATSVDPQTQSQSFLFLVQPNYAKLMAGAAVTGWMKISGESRSGAVVPSDAVVRVDGRAWVYVQTGGHDFTRREISTELPVNGGWFVTQGVAANDKVVMVGAQQLLSEELKAQGGGE